MSFGERPRRSPLPLILVGLVAVGAGVGFAVWSAGVVGAPVTLEVTAPVAVGQTGEVVVVAREPVRGIVDVVVEVSGPGVPPTTLAEIHEAPPARAWDAPSRTEARLAAPIGKRVWPELKEGTLTVVVKATSAGSWWKTPEPVEVKREIAVRLTPPTVSPLSSFVHVAQGGAEALVYEVGPTAVRDGVVVERVDGSTPWTFPGSPFPGGPPNKRLVLFAVPYDDEGPEDVVRGRVKVFAEDDVGNRATMTFIHKFFPRPMPKDEIVLKDAFLAKVTTEIFAQTPELAKSGDLLADYLVINRELRQKNNAALVALAARSTPRFLWKKTFQPFDNASVKGAFADRRTYRYNGAVVDTQDHLGFDLARVERSPVNAGNDGVVLLAGFLGIYGNCVVIDHGIGLMTLYAHLSSIDVKVGDAVTRGQVIGKTGATGLAGGDHLHFTTLLHGYAVNPIEWWDGHWIADRLKLKLGEALPWVESDDDATLPSVRRKKRR
jgi:murein DD-endopeptidase MepM/ murein hydrolase activator NlpD